MKSGHMTNWQRFRHFVGGVFGSKPTRVLRIERQASPVLSVGRGREKPLPSEHPVAVGRPLNFSSKSLPSVPDTRSRRARIQRAFDAASPVRDRFGLSGRLSELSKLSEAVIVQKKHAIIHGARGSGKTSLVRVFGDLADEYGYLVLYESTSSDLSFSELFQPFLSCLPGAEASGRLRSAVQSLLVAQKFTVRDFASLLADVREPVVLIIDEFDRITNNEVKSDIASLMKLLSDMRSQIQIVAVGIGLNLDQLIGGHPSLRRHMASISVGPISSDGLEEVVRDCSERAGVSFEPTAMKAAVDAALGSPYHVRLFGMNAALAANERGVSEVRKKDVEQGFRAALADWAQVSEESYQLFATLSSGNVERSALVQLARQSAGISCSIHEPAGGDRENAARILQELTPVLRPSSASPNILFRDTLAPQFLAIMAMYDVRAA